MSSFRKAKTLNRDEFFLACRFVSLAQSGKVIVYIEG